MINPETGRDIKGRFAKGNSCYPKKKTPREITTAIRAIAADNKVTELALNTLIDICKDKTGAVTKSEKIKAAQFLMTQFTVSAEKDVDKEIAEGANESLSDMLEALQGMKK